MPEIILSALVICPVENCKFFTDCNGKNPKRGYDFICNIEALQRMVKRGLTAREVTNNKSAIIRKAYFGEEDAK